MDQSEILRIISTSNSHWVLSESNLTQCQQELTTVRRSLAQTNRELNEAVKLAELLYETNRRMGIITNYLLKFQGLKNENEKPKSFDAMLNWVTAQSGLSAEHEDNQGGADVQDPTSNDSSAGAKIA